MTKTLFIVRHADALPAQALQVDAQRALSAHGWQQAQTTATWLQAQLQQRGQRRIDWLLVSPYARAQQTAQVLAEQLRVKQQETVTHITPEGDAERVADWLLSSLSSDQANSKVIVLVAHMPLVSYLVAALDAATQPLLFPTAGVAEIELDVAAWQGRFIQLYAP